ncbi:hypothetical protein [Natronococcus occultus]|uniref:Uncharacterized protein n=1 Tax=Natronococcus occultus SP4 TaxID=694430 RepID=L0JZ33_9EURY|nr:hypothetical protein [Natronococcus occultus]AGB37570.1 hypothetical protein Natoc_1771 [Natronococcus occultus SP4]
MRLITAAFDAVRQPAYTGENRCLPCTVVNVAIAIVLAVALGIAATPPIGAVALAVSLATIVLRGYLVPGTPELTKRYLPAPVLELFGKEPIETSSLEDVDPDEPRDVLVAAGVAERTADGALSLTDRFRSAFRDAAESTAPDATDVAILVGADEAVERGPRAYSIDGSRLLRWESDAALVADVAAASVLRATVDDWDSIDRDRRLDLLRRLRLLLERCPDCGGSVVRRRERVDPCCQPPHVSVWSTCRDCEAVLGDVTVPEADGEDWLDALETEDPPIAPD